MTEDDPPSMINIDENPRMKATEFVMVRNRILFRSVLLVRSSNDIPVMKEMYDGTRGRTHGERNESTPARKASGKETSLMEYYPPVSHSRQRLPVSFRLHAAVLLL